jgi:hypothetical protein
VDHEAEELRWVAEGGPPEKKGVSTHRGVSKVLDTDPDGCTVVPCWGINPVLVTTEVRERR